MAELIPNYELSEEHFMEAIKDRIFYAHFRHVEGDRMGGICWPDPSKRELDSKGRVKFYVGLNGFDPLDAQGVSLVHGAIHIDIHEAFMGLKVYDTMERMKADEELFVQDRTTRFMEENQALAMAGVSFLKIKHGDGLQIPLIPESFYTNTA